MRKLHEIWEMNRDCPECKNLLVSPLGEIIGCKLDKGCDFVSNEETSNEPEK